MHAVQVVISSALTICCGLASRDDTFNGTAFDILFQKNLCLGFRFRKLGFRFRVVGHLTNTIIC